MIVNGPDTHWNKVFKQYMREEMEEYMDSEEYEFTKTGKMKPAPYSKICDWVVAAWRKLGPDLIKKSFVETGWEQAFNGNDTSVLHSTLRELVDHNIIREYQRRPDPDEAAAHNLNIQTIRDSMMLGDDVDDIEQADEAVESEDDFEFYRLQAEENASLATTPPWPHTLPADFVDFSAESSSAWEQGENSEADYDDLQQNFRTPHVSEGELDSGEETEIEFIN